MVEHLINPEFCAVYLLGVFFAAVANGSVTMGFTVIMQLWWYVMGALGYKHATSPINILSIIAIDRCISSLYLSGLSVYRRQVHYPISIVLILSSMGFIHVGLYVLTSASSEVTRRLIGATFVLIAIGKIIHITYPVYFEDDKLNGMGTNGKSGDSNDSTDFNKTWPASSITTESTAPLLKESISDDDTEASRRHRQPAPVDEDLEKQPFLNEPSSSSTTSTSSSSDAALPPKLITDSSFRSSASSTSSSSYSSHSMFRRPPDSPSATASPIFPYGVFATEAWSPFFKSWLFPISVVAGSVTGFINGYCGAGGPPLILFFSFSQLHKSVIRGTFSCWAWVSCIFLTASLLARNLVDFSYYPLFIASPIVSIIGVTIGDLLHPIIPTNAVIFYFQILIFVTGVWLYNPFDHTEAGEAGIIFLAVFFVFVFLFVGTYLCLQGRKRQVLDERLDQDG